MASGPLSPTVNSVTCMSSVVTGSVLPSAKYSSQVVSGGT
jgi:hypothetical protein